MMKKLLLINLLLTSIFAFSQPEGISSYYDIGLVKDTKNSFKVVALPNFNGTSRPISKITFTLMLPKGDAVIEKLNASNLLNSGNWNITNNPNNCCSNSNRNAFYFEFNSNSEIRNHDANDVIDLIRFSISNSPTTGSIAFLKNTDQEAINTNFDTAFNTTNSNNEFNSFIAGQDSYSFSNLNTNTISGQDIIITMYPNPTKGIINLKSTNKDIAYSLYNVLGQPIGIQQFLNKNSAHAINLTNERDGVYLLKVKTDGDTYKTFKIVKQNK